MNLQLSRDRLRELPTPCTDSWILGWTLINNQCKKIINCCVRVVDYSLICLRKQWSQATLVNWTRQSEQKLDLICTMEERGSGSTVLTWLVSGINKSNNFDHIILISCSQEQRQTQVQAVWCDQGSGWCCLQFQVWGQWSAGWSDWGTLSWHSSSPLHWALLGCGEQGLRGRDCVPCLLPHGDSYPHVLC